MEPINQRALYIIVVSSPPLTNAETDICQYKTYISQFCKERRLQVQETHLPIRLQPSELRTAAGERLLQRMRVSRALSAALFAMTTVGELRTTAIRSPKRSEQIVSWCAQRVGIN